MGGRMGLIPEVIQEVIHTEVIPEVIRTCILIGSLLN